MPAGIALFLAYALLILALVGLSLRFVVDQAISAPISPIGIVVMALLAYTVFTVTLVVQRKEAGRNLAIGLASLTVPGVPLAWFTFEASVATLPLDSTSTFIRSGRPGGGYGFGGGMSTSLLQSITALVRATAENRILQYGDVLNTSH